MARPTAAQRTARLKLGRAKANVARQSGIYLDGLTSTMRTLDAAPKEVRAELRRELKQIADEALVVAKTLVPRGKTGKLAGSLFSQVTKRGARIGSRRTPYAPIIEFGKKRKKPKPKGQTTRRHRGSTSFTSLKPQPFLMPAANRVGPRAEQRASRAIQKALDRAVTGSFGGS